MFPSLRQSQSADQALPAKTIPAMASPQITPAWPGITLSGASSPGQSTVPLAQILEGAAAAQNQVDQNVGNLAIQQLAMPAGILSPGEIMRQAFIFATQALPQDDKPKGKKDKVKLILRRLLLPKFVLRMFLGSTLADLVYPWIHPET